MKENSNPGVGAAGIWGHVPVWLQIPLGLAITALSLPLGVSDGGLGPERRPINLKV